MTTTTLDAAIEERDEAISRVDAAADAAWKLEADTLLRRLAVANAAITADDLWLNGLSTPREPRALGGVLTRGARAGVIERTEQSVRSVRRHATPITVWKSLVYKNESGSL